MITNDLRLAQPKGFNPRLAIAEIKPGVGLFG
jgi:hypothetical protein